MCSFAMTSGSVKARARARLIRDLLEPSDLLGLEELAERLDGRVVHLLGDLLLLRAALFTLEPLKLFAVFRHLFSGRGSVLLCLVDLFVVELQLLLDAGVADQHGQAAAAAHHAEASTLTLRKRRPGEQRDQTETNQCANHRSHGGKLLVAE